MSRIVRREDELDRDAMAIDLEQLAAEQQAAHATLSMSQQKLGAAQYELKLRSLRAPFDARVTHVAVQPGASVGPTSGALFTLLPDRPRTAPQARSPRRLGRSSRSTKSPTFACATTSISSAR